MVVVLNIQLTIKISGRVADDLKSGDLVLPLAIAPEVLESTSIKIKVLFEVFKFLFLVCLF